MNHAPVALNRNCKMNVTEHFADTFRMYSIYLIDAVCSLTTFPHYVDKTHDPHGIIFLATRICCNNLVVYKHNFQDTGLAHSVTPE